MRDPARIPRILEALRVEWEKTPDLRLGQLLCNAARVPAPYQLYYVRDEELVEDVKRLMAPKGPEEGK